MSIRPGPSQLLVRDEGSGPASVLAWLGTTLTVLSAVGLLGVGWVAQARADSAADFAALAAADAVAVGAGSEACTRALAVADRHGTALISCQVEDLEVEVTVALPVHGALPDARGVARAGPASHHSPER